MCSFRNHLLLVVSSSFVTTTVLLISDAQAEVAASISVLSDYRYRGLSQTGESNALQGNIEYFHNSGLYLGWWGSNVDYYANGDLFDNHEGIENDFYIGYSTNVNESLAFDVTYYQYLYPGTNENVNSGELTAGLDYKSIRLAYWYSDNTFNLGESDSYFEANYALALPAQFELTFHTGYSFGDSLLLLGLDNYVDYSISLAKNIVGIDFAVEYTNTDFGGAFAISNGFNANQEALVFSLRKKLDKK